jgi:hypothetical protein
MILRLLGIYLFAEGLGSMVYYWKEKTFKNYVFQTGRIAKATIGVFLILL